MSTAAVGRATTERPEPADDIELEVQVNALTVDQLFALYERTGFLYPAKAARLMPHLATVQENWRRLLATGSSVLYVLSTGNDSEGYASVVVWRTTRESWVWQHLVCEGSPLRSRGVMLGGQLRCLRLGIGESQQNWFRPENRFPARVFGTMVQAVGPSLSSIRQQMYFAVPRQPRLSRVRSIRVVPYDPSLQPALAGLAAHVRGELFVKAEELDRDVELRSVDALYRAVGLRRTRQVWLAYRAGSGQVVGAALAYRGPLGLNFSFIENRCDLLVSPGLLVTEAADVSTALLEAAATAYADCPLDDIPVVANEVSAGALVAAGGQLLRNYCHGIWLKDGQAALYRHVDGFYSRLLNRAGRNRPASTQTA